MEYAMTVNKVPNGVKKKPRGGSRKGCPNKVTKTLKEMILSALDGAGGELYLQRQAEENPGPFLALIGKVLPSTMAITGPAGKDFKITFEIIRPKAIHDKQVPSLPHGEKTPDSK
jgi:hypothetical protein